MAVGLWPGHVQVYKTCVYDHHKTGIWIVQVHFQIIPFGKKQPSTDAHKAGGRNETSKHLTRCTDLGCLLQLHISIKTIINVLDSANNAPALADMIETYLLNQGHQTMADCTHRSSPYWILAISIDNLGWDWFVECRLPLCLINVISHMLHCYKPRGSINLWGIKFINGLIGLTHKQ